MLKKLWQRLREQGCSYAWSQVRYTPTYTENLNDMYTSLVRYALLLREMLYSTLLFLLYSIIICHIINSHVITLTLYSILHDLAVIKNLV